MIYPLSKSTADQFTTVIKVGAFRDSWKKKPQIIAICKVKPKIPRKRIELDFVIPVYSLHSLNSDSDIGQGKIIYIHSSIDNCVIQINPVINFSEVCLLEIWLCGGNNLLFGCLYRCLTTASISEKDNANLNNLL